MNPVAALPPGLVDLDAADRAHLLRALDLGREGWGFVHPNPMVGCVLVRDGEVVGEGWHARYGGPHAETVALGAAGERARGSTAYVSLEPCRHEGKTPACTRALIASGVTRVVFGAADPGSDSGGGAAELASAGIDVVGPALSGAEARRENPAFFHRHASPLPWVAAKLAVSLDAKVAARPGERTQLTGDVAAGFTHTLRAGFDAVVIGANTQRIDDAQLTLRHGARSRRPPVRIVLDPGARTASDAAILRDVSEAPTWIFCRDDADEADLERLERAGARVHPVAVAAGQGLDLGAVLRVCREADLVSVLVEGGPTVLASFVRAGLVGRLHLLVAPRVLGGEAVDAFGDGWNAPPQGWHPAADPRLLGDDTLLVFDRDGG